MDSIVNNDELSFRLFKLDMIESLTDVENDKDAVRCLNRLLQKAKRRMRRTVPPIPVEILSEDTSNVSLRSVVKSSSELVVQNVSDTTSVASNDALSTEDGSYVSQSECSSDRSPPRTPHGHHQIHSRRNVKGSHSSGGGKSSITFG